jgi:hypothetical protein
MQPCMRVRGGIVMAVIVIMVMTMWMIMIVIMCMTVVMVMRMVVIMFVTMVMIMGVYCNNLTGVKVSYSGFSVIGATASYTPFNKPPSL